MCRTTNVPDGVAALAQKVGESLDAEDSDDLELSSTLESMTNIGNLFQVDTFSDRDDTATQ